MSEVLQYGENLFYRAHVKGERDYMHFRNIADVADWIETKLDNDDDGLGMRIVVRLVKMSREDFEDLCEP